jgi:hypothetical protein
MTAEQYILENFEVNHADKDIQEAMIGFAKYHVEAALKEASEKAYARGKGSSLTTKDKNFFYTFAGHIGEIEMNKSSILNAYPLQNIK